MLMPLLLGSLTVVISMGVQVVAVILMVRYLLKVMDQQQAKPESFTFDALILSTVLLVLFGGHLVQIGIWAALFLQLGEFSDFETAFYHSAVNFAALGYGDIVMSARWRLLGAFEAGNGVLMFGLSAGTLFAVMSQMFVRRKPSLRLEKDHANK